MKFHDLLNSQGFCWLQEFSDSRDADDARHYLNGKDFDGNRLIVEFARRVGSILTLFTPDHEWCSVCPLKYAGFSISTFMEM